MGNLCSKGQHAVSDNRGNSSSQRNGSGSTSNICPTDDYHNGDKTETEAKTNRSREAGLGVPVSGLERVPGPNRAASGGEVNVEIPSAHVDLNTHSANEGDAAARHGTAGNSGGNDSSGDHSGGSARKERRHRGGEHHSTKDGDRRSRRERERERKSTSQSGKGENTGTTSSKSSGRKEEGGSLRRGRDRKKVRANGDHETVEARERREKREKKERRKRREAKAAAAVDGRKNKRGSSWSFPKEM